MSGLASAAKGTNPATREIIAKALLSQDPQAVLLAAKRVGVPTELARQMVEALMRGGAMRGPQ
jgi:predicted ArsR family transcriptional regulator